MRGEMHSLYACSEKESRVVGFRHARDAASDKYADIFVTNGCITERLLSGHLGKLNVSWPFEPVVEGGWMGDLRDWGGNLGGHVCELRVQVSPLLHGQQVSDA